LVEGCPDDDDAVLRRDHGVLEAPGAGGGSAVDADLRLACGVHRDDVRSKLGAEERDDLIAAGDLQRLLVDARAVVDGSVRREHVRELVPPLLVDAAKVAVFHLSDLFERNKVHVHQLGAFA
jgi:hypothetical protein